jgi:NAD(P)-dependent dehydrogenase (short-subunit alcohol dehydrogenase family)
MSPSRNQGAQRPVAVVTGSSAGVGRAVAIAFARRGFRVALIARGRDRLHSAGLDVAAAGGEAMEIAADVSDAGAVEGAADRVAEAWGGIDLWVNAAMATVYSPVAQITPEEVRRVTEVTYLGTVHGTLAALRHMRRRDQGAIVQIGSALAYRAIPLQSAYCAAKFAVRGFTDSLRTELLHEGSRIRLTMVQLPAVDTPQFDWARSRMPGRLQPVGAIYAPDAVAEAVVRAAFDAPRELWVGGPAIQAILAQRSRRLGSTASRGAPMTGRLPPSRRSHATAICSSAWRRPRPARAVRRTLACPGGAISDATARGVLAAGALGLLAGAAALGWRFGAARRRATNRRLPDRERAARLVA